MNFGVATQTFKKKIIAKNRKKVTGEGFNNV